MGYYLLMVCVVGVLGVAYGQQTDEHGHQVWDRTKYPHPKEDLNACGREGKESYVCDPGLVITLDQANSLDEDIDKVMREVECPCSHNECLTTTGPQGHRIAIALVDKMSEEGTDNNDDEAKTLQTNLHKAKLFAYHLLTKWKLDRCGEQIIIFYSKQDNVYYTMTGDVAAMKLTPALIGEIAMNVRRYFGSDVYSGLKELIATYKDVLLGRYRGLNIVPVEPRVGAVRGRDGGGQSVMPTLVVTTLSVFAAIVATVCRW